MQNSNPLILLPVTTKGSGSASSDEGASVVTGLKEEPMDVDNTDREEVTIIMRVNYIAPRNVK